MALKKLDLAKVQEAKDKLIYQKAKEYKATNEKINKIKSEMLKELEGVRGTLTQEIIDLFKDIEERTRVFEDFTMRVTKNSFTRKPKYENVIRELHSLYGKTVDGFAETLDNLIEANTEIRPKSGSITIKEGIIDTIVKFFTKLINKLKSTVNSILKTKIDANISRMEKLMQPILSESIQPKKRVIKLSEAIRLVENKTGKKVVLKESVIGVRTQKFVKELLNTEEPLGATRQQLLIIVNAFFEQFKKISEYNIYVGKIQRGNKQVLMKTIRDIAEKTSLPKSKVQNVINTIVEHIPDSKEFRRIYVEFKKGLLANFILNRIPKGALKGYEPETKQ